MQQNSYPGNPRQGAPQRQVHSYPGNAQHGAVPAAAGAGQGQAVHGHGRPSVGVAAAAAAAPAGQGLELGQFDFGAEPTFNPSRPAHKAQLLQKLAFPSSATVTAMQGFRGGLNEGVWYVACPGRDELVLKLVRCKRLATNILTEAENFAKLSTEYPTAYRDPQLALPLKILSCLGRGGEKKNDLIIMRKVRGERLAEWIAKKWHGSQSPQMMQLFERLGARLAEYHARYGNAQHGDFQPSNIFYDEARDALCFIDMGGMGVPTMETDVEHFVKSLTLLAQSYGNQLAIDGERHFKQGYAQGGGRR